MLKRAFCFGLFQPSSNYRRSAQRLPVLASMTDSKYPLGNRSRWLRLRPSLICSSSHIPFRSFPTLSLHQILPPLQGIPQTGTHHHHHAIHPGCFSRTAARPGANQPQAPDGFSSSIVVNAWPVEGIDPEFGRVPPTHGCCEIPCCCAKTGPE